MVLGFRLNSHGQTRGGQTGLTAPGLTDVVHRSRSDRPGSDRF